MVKHGKALQHKPPYCNICLGTVPKALQVFPTSSTSHAALRVSGHYIMSSVVLGSSPRQFASSYSYSHPLLGHNFVHPSLCRCRRSSRAEPWQSPGHTATAARRPSAASVTASWDIRAAADPISTIGHVWEMRRRQLAEAIRRAIHSASTVSANRQVLISSNLCVLYARSIVWPPSGWI
jgi:hypothetical protein